MKNLLEKTILKITEKEKPIFYSRYVKFDMNNQYEICKTMKYIYDPNNKICKRCPYKVKCIKK